MLAQRRGEPARGGCIGQSLPLAILIGLVSRLNTGGKVQSLTQSFAALLKDEG